ncbi:YhfC family glutamic-type intramembrane protease [Bacillus spizizenii]|nr:YhfC family glutamic-type intramembrane protease [Bacillus spizizenii]MCY8109887.1 YhfC family glutamic-type intramembrane protease [Bacillus spizizenii]MCY8304254.1 YhfC family glutamic-type intramembrane protease [Bacillus spizizenii]MCY8660806.1 YhfC family glutamic-type intramembrane protease [Bacillus spizizenii]MCY8687583.1 YhfC family glutamic-type intramembrane protease [Bacillus spizizenii]
MVSQESIVFMAVSGAVAFLLPIGLIVWFKRKYGASLKVFFIGALTFFVFAQLLESGVHVYVLQVNEMTKEAMQNPLWYGIYGCLMAGIFEECGRYIMMRFFMKRHHAWADGLAFGTGHGGLEAILITGLSSISLIVYAFAINNGTFEQFLINENIKQALLPIQEQLLHTHSYEWLLGGIERISAIAVQIGLSLLVLYAVKSHRLLFLLYSILLHALFNVPAVLYQKRMIEHAAAVEIIVALIAAISVYWSVKAKSLFQ